MINIRCPASIIRTTLCYHLKGVTSLPTMSYTNLWIFIHDFIQIVMDKEGTKNLSFEDIQASKIVRLKKKIKVMKVAI